MKHAPGIIMKSLQQGYVVSCRHVLSIVSWCLSCSLPAHGSLLWLPSQVFVVRDTVSSCSSPNGAPQVTLFIGNLTPQWTDVERLRAEMGAHGSIERAAVLHNAQGASKVLYRPPPRPSCSCTAVVRNDASKRGLPAATHFPVSPLVDYHPEPPECAPAGWLAAAFRHYRLCH